MGHGAGRGTPPHRWSEAVQVWVLEDVLWETNCQNTRQKWYEVPVYLFESAINVLKKSRWARDFPPVQTGPGAHPASCPMGTGSFPEVKCGRGVMLATYPLLLPQSWKSRAIPLPKTVGIATDYWLTERSGVESRWGRDFPPVQTSPGAHPASCKMGTGSFPRVKCGRGVLLTTHLLVPRSWKNRAIPLPTLWATPDLRCVW